MFSRKIKLISRKLRGLDGTKQIDFYLKKPVISKSGEHVGKVYDIVFKNGFIEGILVSGKKKIFVGKEYFSINPKQHIILSIEPVTNMIGKQVFDSTGKMIGKVKDILRKSNANIYYEIKVKGSFFKRSFNIPKKEVGVAKKSIILKYPYEKNKK